MSLPTSGISILVVENDAINVLVIERLYKEHQVFKAKNSTTALLLLDNQVFDLVLMDINLGDDSLDGLELAKKFREHVNKPRYIFAITGYTSLEENENYQIGLFDKVCTKPINHSELKLTIKNLFVV